MPDRDGSRWAAGGSSLTAREMAKLGYLFLRGGTWDGEQIVTPEWVEAATAEAHDDGQCERLRLPVVDAPQVPRVHGPGALRADNLRQPGEGPGGRDPRAGAQPRSDLLLDRDVHRAGGPLEPAPDLAAPQLAVEHGVLAVDAARTFQVTFDACPLPSGGL